MHRYIVKSSRRGLPWLTRASAHIGRAKILSVRICGYLCASVLEFFVGHAAIFASYLDYSATTIGRSAMIP
jgi:hypothetical protein